MAPEPPASRFTAPIGTRLNIRTGFAGCLILIVEDEPMIALDIAEIFKAAGARVFLAVTHTEALKHVEERRSSTRAWATKTQRMYARG